MKGLVLLYTFVSLNWKPMKQVLTLITFAIVHTGYLCSQTITVDAAKVIKTFDHNPTAINLNYLMDDDSYLHPAVSCEQSLKNMNIGMVRYPGGEKSDNYLWSVAPYTKANPRFATVGTCNWPNNDNRFSSDQISPKATTLDFDEMMELATAAGVKPLIVVAGDAQYNTKCTNPPTFNDLITNAVEWVRYANIVKKYNIKYWMIGNESWNAAAYDPKVSTPTQYANDFVAFAKAMKAVDPSIVVVANSKPGTWVNTLLAVSDGYVDAIAISNYPVLNWFTGYDTFRTGTPSFVSEINSVISSIGSRNIKVIVSEYNSIDWNNVWANTNDLGHALVNFQMFGDQIKIPQVQDAYLWNTRWVDNDTKPQGINDAVDASGNLNATGLALSMWGNNFLDKLVTSNNSGYINAFASVDNSGDKMNVLLVNKDLVSHSVTVNIANFKNITSVSHSKLTGSSSLDTKPIISYPKNSVAFNSNSISVSLDPMSINSLNINKLTSNLMSQISYADSYIAYPNPVLSMLNLDFISSVDNPIQLKIYDCMGMLVSDVLLYNQKNQIAFEQYPSGIYFISIGNSKKIIVKK
jgi:alpha-L-arabinofuranosidase